LTALGACLLLWVTVHFDFDVHVHLENASLTNKEVRLNHPNSKVILLIDSSIPRASVVFIDLLTFFCDPAHMRHLRGVLIVHQHR
jgi:hypothetical protein